MKYLYIGCALLAVLLVACIWSGSWLAGAAQETAAVLRQAQAALSDGDPRTAAAQAYAAQQQWSERLGAFGSILCHDETDEVTVAFAELLACDPVTERAEFQRSCARLVTRLEHLSATDLPLLPNIL